MHADAIVYGGKNRKPLFLAIIIHNNNWVGFCVRDNLVIRSEVG